MITLKLEQSDARKEIIAHIGKRCSVIDYSNNKDLNLELKKGNETLYIHPEKKNNENYLIIGIKDNTPKK
jgi:hypothetical protein